MVHGCETKKLSCPVKQLPGTASRQNGVRQTKIVGAACTMAKGPTNNPPNMDANSSLVGCVQSVFHTDALPG